MAPIVIVCVLAFSGQGYLRFPPESVSLRWFAAFFGDAALAPVTLVEHGDRADRLCHRDRARLLRRLCAGARAHA